MTWLMMWNARLHVSMWHTLGVCVASLRRILSQSALNRQILIERVDNPFILVVSPLFFSNMGLCEFYFIASDMVQSRACDLLI